MTEIEIQNYTHIRSGSAGFYEQDRGLIAVWGKEAIQFLDGLITNDMKTLGDGQQMIAAFPNAQGRLLAVVRVLRQGERFLFETEGATREKVFNNLFRFTFAGDFFVEDLSEGFSFFELFGISESSTMYEGGVAAFRGRGGSLGSFISAETSDQFREQLIKENTIQISDDIYETLRIENGVPKYGVDMDETTIVPELGLDSLISYNKGCYIGQEIIARIHFRGHVAKQLTGLVSEPPAVAGGLTPGAELTTKEGKNAGRITSVTYSPKLKNHVCLAFVRYEFLNAGTRLHAGDVNVEVANLPFV